MLSHVVVGSMPAAFCEKGVLNIIITFSKQNWNWSESLTWKTMALSWNPALEMDLREAKRKKSLAKFVLPLKEHAT